MKPAKFDYHAPTTVDDAVALLAGGGDARVLAGGQTLIPMMNFRLAAPAVIVDLNRIPELATIKDDGDTVRIGAMTRQRAVEFSPVVAEKLPLLAKAIKLVGHLPTRTRGTIGGSLCHLDPSAELVTVAAAHDATVVGLTVEPGVEALWRPQLLATHELGDPVELVGAEPASGQRRGAEPDAGGVPGAVGIGGHRQRGGTHESVGNRIPKGHNRSR